MTASGGLTVAGQVLGRLSAVTRLVYPGSVLIVAAVVWQISATAAHSLLIPTFTATASAFVQLLGTPALWDALIVSNQALVIGFAISVVAGIPFGLALGRYRRANIVANPYLTILLTLPTAGLVPLLIMSVGVGLLARVVIIVLFTITVLIVNARAGVREVDPTLLEMARSFGARETELWRKVLLPSSLPAILVGVRLGLGRAVTGMVIVELLLVAAGIGNLILVYQSQLRPAFLYATVIIVVLEAVGLIALAHAVARIVAPWASHPVE